MTGLNQQHNDHCILKIEDHAFLIVGKEGPLITLARPYGDGVLEVGVVDMDDIDLDEYTTGAARLLEDEMNTEKRPDENPMLTDLTKLTLQRIGDALHRAMELLERPQDKLALCVLMAHQTVRGTLAAAEMACPEFNRLDETGKTVVLLGVIAKTLTNKKPGPVNEAQIQSASKELERVVVSSGRMA